MSLDVEIDAEGETYFQAGKISQSEFDATWERVLRTARESQISTDDWELREPSSRAGHYYLQMHRGPNGPEVRPIGRGKTQAYVTLHAIEAVLRHTREWRMFHDYHEFGDKSQSEKKREVTR